MAVNLDLVSHVSGATLLTRAVELDKAGRYTESLVFYESGIQQLMVLLKKIKEEDKKQHYRKKISEYMDRAEKIKDTIKKEKDAGKYHEQIKIQENGTGYSYNKIFQHFIDSLLTEVYVEDPYIRNIHQIYNFLRFCELFVSSECAKVKKIHLVTGMDENQQKTRLSELAESLTVHGIELVVDYSDTLHDREIKFNNGWIIKIGRGLDIYKPAPSKFSIGYCNFDLRPCHETTIDIFYSKDVQMK
ncbi:hypothetical protein LSH36_736g00069 [Paralvinella palmiformis]|uniref:MIT domain-containing protein n=1 Tax=Paralvinella palmiformis TaxID=53620 RepID=A0AAD9MUL5_9ANNE|nr:hypothetical protein LSH36_736g00069 [Paralvinella palmiformis]